MSDAENIYVLTGDSFSCVEESMVVNVDRYFLRVDIGYDPCPSNPRRDPHLAEFICFHKRYQLGDEHSFESPDDFLEWMDSKEAKYYLVEELYLYDHGDLALSTGPFNDPWDSGQVGWVRVDLRKACEEVYPGRKYERLRGDARLKVREYAKQVIKGEINEYTDYINGTVFLFRIWVWEKIGENEYRLHKDLCNEQYNCLGHDTLKAVLLDDVARILRTLGIPDERIQEVQAQILDRSKIL